MRENHGMEVIAAGTIKLRGIFNEKILTAVLEECGLSPKAAAIHHCEDGSREIVFYPWSVPAENKSVIWVSYRSLCTAINNFDGAAGGEVIVMLADAAEDGYGKIRDSFKIDYDEDYGEDYGVVAISHW